MFASQGRKDFLSGTSGSYSLEIENVAEFSEVCSKVENGKLIMDFTSTHPPVP